MILASGRRDQQTKRRKKSGLTTYFLKPGSSGRKKSMVCHPRWPYTLIILQHILPDFIESARLNLR
jgi:hypothetical protein